MAIGTCDCLIGCDGSPCAHQHFLWADNIADSLNFIPIFNEEKGQQFAKVALGSSLPLSHCSSRQENVDFVSVNMNRDELNTNVLVCLFAVQ